MKISKSLIQDAPQSTENSTELFLENMLPHYPKEKSITNSRDSIDTSHAVSDSCHDLFVMSPYYSDASYPGLPLDDILQI